METIAENIRLYSDAESKLHLESERLCFIDMFLQRYPLSPVEPALRIFHDRKVAIQW
jgi:hypothetical protein